MLNIISKVIDMEELMDVVLYQEPLINLSRTLLSDFCIGQEILISLFGNMLTRLEVHMYMLVRMVEHLFKLFLKCNVFRSILFLNTIPSHFGK